MPIWNKIKDEVERAGRAANSAIDEGKLRLTLLRARQTADHAAERLGYALFRAKQKGEELTADLYNRHASELSAAEAEIARLETLLTEAAARRGPAKPPSAEPAAAAADRPTEPKPADAPPGGAREP